MKSKHSEDLRINEFIGNKENTMNSVVSNSVGMGLLKLSKVYFDKKSQKDIESQYQICMDEIKNLASENQLDACRYLESVAAQPVDQYLDILRLYIQNKAKKILHYFPLKEVITLIWLAIKDKNKYECYLDIEFTQDETELNYLQKRQNAIEQDYQHRLETFYNCLERLYTDNICHHGTRNELVFLLNKSYPGIDLIEDKKSTIFFILKENLTQQFLNLYTSGNLQFKKELTRTLIDWLTTYNCTEFSKLVDPNQSIIENLQLLFIEHGTHYTKIDLEQVINEAITNINFAADPKTHPSLYYIQRIFQEFNGIPTHPNQKKSLKLIKQWLQTEADLLNQTHVNYLETFCLYNECYDSFIKHQSILKITGTFPDNLTFFIKEIEEYFESYVINQQLPEVVLSDKHRNLKDLLITSLQHAKKDNMSDQIENFFCKWFATDLTSQELIAIRQSLYPLLLMKEMQKNILLSNKAITTLYNSHVEGILDLSSYLINRVFLHAITISPKEWTPEFGGIIAAHSSQLEGGVFFQVLDFVKNQFNQNNENLALQLKKESYPQSLLDQLTYLQKIYREKVWDDLTEEEQQKRDALDIHDTMERPKEMILLPTRMQTVEDWLQIANYLCMSKNIWQQTYQMYRANINRLFGSTIPLNLVVEYGKSIPETLRNSFLSQSAAKIAVNIKNIEDLLFILKKLSAERQLIFIPLITDKIKLVIKNSHPSATFLSELPEESQRALITVLGEDCKVLLPDSLELKRVLLLLPEKDQLDLIEKLGEEGIKQIVAKYTPTDSIRAGLWIKERVSLLINKHKSTLTDVGFFSQSKDIREELSKAWYQNISVDTIGLIC